MEAKRKRGARRRGAESVSPRVRNGRALARWRETSFTNKGITHPGMTKEELAAKIGRSMSTVQRWERGAMEPKTTDLQVMERVKPGLLEMLFPHLSISPKHA